MQKIVFGLIFLSCSICGAAQTIRIRSVVGGIVVTKGKVRSAIGLSNDISGCAYTPAGYERSLPQKDCGASPATFKLVDAMVKNRQTFLIVQADAADNCNVCGQCGATEAFSLVWLKLDNRLHILDKKSVSIEDCRLGVSLVSEPGIDDTAQNLNLKFKNDSLTIEFEERIYNNNLDVENYNFSHLEYSRKTPEKGFVIKTENRAKSSVKEN